MPRRKFDVPFHTDAVQALGQLPLDLRGLDAAAVTLSSHKIGGPVGIGALIIDPTVKFTPVQHGGGQEREIRSGTFDPASIAAFAAAVRHAISGLDEHATRLRELQCDNGQGYLFGRPRPAALVEYERV